MQLRLVSIVTFLVTAEAAMVDAPIPNPLKSLPGQTMKVKLSADPMLIAENGGGSAGRQEVHTASEDGPLVIDDIPFHDPTGVATKHMHEKGLRPSGGATEKDPHLFRHRYQNYDEATNKLMYYQYEARRHAHVVVLDTLRVQGCEAATDGDEATELTLVFMAEKDAINLTTGAVILGHELGCVTHAPNGTQSPWRKSLRERILGSVRVARRSPQGVAVTFMTSPAALNEVFEHGLLEFYHGHPDHLNASRTKRLDSLATKGHDDNTTQYNFARSAEVLVDAKATAASRRALSEPVVRRVVPVKDRARNHSGMPGRRLDHCWFNAANDLSDAMLFGSDCNDGRTPGSHMEGENCYFLSGGELAFKAGNQYTLKWKSGTSESRVKIEIWEEDPWNPDDPCFYWWADNQFYTGNVQYSPNTLTFTMPNLYSHSCGTDGGGTWGFPEFYIHLETQSGCHTGRWPSAGLFRQTYDSDYQGQITLEESTTTKTWGSQSAGASLACNGCHVDASGDAHVLVRIDQYNPFAESWSWADASFEADVDLVANAWVNKQLSWGGSYGSLLCLAPLCYGGVQFADLHVYLGLMSQFALTASVSFDAQAQVTYRRHVKATGTFSLHTVGATIVSRGANDMAFQELSQENTQPASLRINLDAQAQVGLHSRVYAGLFASYSTSAEAEVYVRADADLYVRANFYFRSAIGTQNVLSPVYDCSSAVIGCNQACSSPHDTRLSMNAYGRFQLAYKVYAQANWGPWSASVGSDYETSVDISGLNWDKWIGSRCYYFFPPSPSPPPPPSPSPPPPSPSPSPLPSPSPPSDASPGGISGDATSTHLSAQADESSGSGSLLIALAGVGALLLTALVMLAVCLRHRRAKRPGAALEQRADAGAEMQRATIQAGAKPATIDPHYRQGRSSSSTGAKIGAFESYKILLLSRLIARGAAQASVGRGAGLPPPGPAIRDTTAQAQAQAALGGPPPQPGSGSTTPRGSEDERKDNRGSLFIGQKVGEQV